MTPSSSGIGLLAPVERLIGAWFDREPGGRATLVLLVLFVAVWTPFQIVSFSSLDLHPDLTELYAWTHHLSAGYYKHPPLKALIAAAWFSVFPVADWSFHLLAMTNAAIALFAIDLIARRYLTGDKRLFVLLFLLLTPFYQFHSFIFNANAILLSTWPIAVYCFLRAFETRGILWSAAAGIAAALAMLGKYYSFYLVVGLIVAGLSHPGRWTFLKSSSPWISVAAGLAVLVPHLNWLTTTGYQPFEYAFRIHGSASQLKVLKHIAGNLAGAIGYVAVPLAAYFLAVRPDRRVLARALWPSDPGLRMLVVLFAVPLLLPPLSAPVLGVMLSSIWTMQAWFLLPIILLAPKAVVLPRRAAVNAALLVLAITAAVMAAAPGLAWFYHLGRLGQNAEGSAYYRLVSEEISKAWRQTTGTPLRIVIGDPYFAVAASFYGPDHPDSVFGFDIRLAPWVTDERLEREGFAVVCRADNVECTNMASQRAAANPLARTHEIEVPNRYLGHTSATKKFLILIVPPRALASRPPGDVAGDGALPT